MEWQAGEYFRVERDGRNEAFISARNEVVVVALNNNGEVIFVVEPSAAFGEPVLLLPGGTEEPGEPHMITANRELQEEVGLRASQLDFLGAFRPFSKYLRLTTYMYLARNLTPSQLQGDETHDIGIEGVSLQGPDGFEHLIAIGRLVDARAIAALFLTLNFLKRPTPPAN